MAGRLATGSSSGLVGDEYLLDTAKDAFDIILQIGAATGLRIRSMVLWRVSACVRWSDDRPFAVSLSCCAGALDRSQHARAC
jgi:hypothetical protein